jgi:thermostable 8-oxoguanine DNA glycosylase
MIEPTNVTCFNRTDAELEEFMLFCIVVAGKNAATQARLLHRFLYEMVTAIDGKFCARYDGRTVAQIGALGSDTPFARIRFLAQHGILGEFVRASKLGQYSKLERSFNQIAHKDIDLRSCTLQELESIHGIGFKTSRFFLVHTRPDQPYAILDTHILKYMRNEMGLANIPKNTPRNYKEYARLEKLFVDHCKSLGRSVADLDLMIWKKYSRSATQNMDHVTGQ